MGDRQHYDKAYGIKSAEPFTLFKDLNPSTRKRVQEEWKALEARPTRSARGRARHAAVHAGRAWRVASVSGRRDRTIVFNAPRPPSRVTGCCFSYGVLIGPRTGHM